MLYVWGKNTNNLIKNNHKSTYSVPQKLPSIKNILKCACGPDYILLLLQNGSVCAWYQSAIYSLSIIPQLIDIGTDQGLVVGITKTNKVILWEFKPRQFIENTIKYSQISFPSKAASVSMKYGSIFILTNTFEAYHIKKNNWYNEISISSAQKVHTRQRILQIASGQVTNVFLTYEGQILTSTKQDPLRLHQLKTQQKFISIAASNYQGAITKKGQIIIWGQNYNGNFSLHTQFSKLSKKFISISINEDNGYALADDGEVWIWGKNAHGQLGVSDYQPRSKPFPLITIQSQTVLGIFAGQSYACCICQPNQRKSKRINFNQEIGMNIQLPDKTKKQVQKKVPNKQNIHPIAKKASKPKKPIDEFKAARKNLIEKKSHDNRSKTPQNPKHSKKSTPKNNSNLTSISEKNHGTPKAPRVHSEIKAYCSQAKAAEKIVQHLKMQNKKLKKCVEDKDRIIRDIVSKMQLLQDAIQQYERTLTKRDNLMQQFQRREKLYTLHINELQRTLQQIIKQKNEGHTFSHIYDQLKQNFNKQKVYYEDKLKEQQVNTQNQRHQYRVKIKDLQEQIASFREKEISIRQMQDLLLNRNLAEVNKTIDKIQYSKGKINKSADKLLNLLETSPRYCI